MDYQLDAIEAVCDLFKGQEVSRGEFTVSHGVAGEQPRLEETEFGIGNLLGSAGSRSFSRT